MAPNDFRFFKKFVVVTDHNEFCEIIKAKDIFIEIPGILINMSTQYVIYGILDIMSPQHADHNLNLIVFSLVAAKNKTLLIDLKKNQIYSNKYHQGLICEAA